PRGGVRSGGSTGWPARRNGSGVGGRERVGRGRQGELEAAADTVGVVGHRDRAAVAPDDPPADGQPQPGALVLLAVGPVEVLEDPVALLGRDTDAVVADLDP